MAMAAWILGSCGANAGGAPAFFQCQPTDPYANVEIPDLVATLSVPRIKYVVHPDNRRRRNRLDRYGDEITVEGGKSNHSGSVLPSPTGVFHRKRNKREGSGRQENGYSINVHGGGLTDGSEHWEIGSDGQRRLVKGSRDGLYRTPYGAAGRHAHDSAMFTDRYDRDGKLLPPPISPVSEAQVSARSSDRIRSLQAMLGGSALTDRHGKPPPLSAPYYKSGALLEADDDLDPIAVSTPEMLRESAWVR
eukprot:Blabericola_migrator_1__4484@NODE_2395_length_2831_cov_111_752171_g1500_i0_p2_GENE_NODE_2395_length_2831_cov_111_752171_g1500_i0NODE_2395_length_2831_cov_111_752171_g1500_i0_p2_ORF_typecomplete_len248_score11_66_NODE_2395_length_2831_cov_111_752171_g1500_i04931236